VGHGLAEQGDAPESDADPLLQLDELGRGLGVVGSG
jgi:hypothetical protein